MNQMLFRCLLLNLASIAVSAALLGFYPKHSGFTVGSHYLGGGFFLGGMLLCVLDLAIGLYLAWSLFQLR